MKMKIRYFANEKGQPKPGAMTTGLVLNFIFLAPGGTIYKL